MTLRRRGYEHVIVGGRKTCRNASSPPASCGCLSVVQAGAAEGVQALTPDLAQLDYAFDVSSRFVVCDFCGVDYTNRSIRGGVLIGKKPACPGCAVRLEAAGRSIRGRCSKDSSFAEWVLDLRAWAEWEADAEAETAVPRDLSAAPKTWLRAWAEWEVAHGRRSHHRRRGRRSGTRRLRFVEEALARNPDTRTAQEAVRAARNRPAQVSALRDAMICLSSTSEGWPPSLGKMPDAGLAVMVSQDPPGAGRRRRARRRAR